MPHPKLHSILKSPELSLYQVEGLQGGVSTFVASTPQTRAICNDPFVVGIEYTQKLQTACSQALQGLKQTGKLNLREQDTIVLNILRGGLNFGLREALHSAYGWNSHGSAFLSAQRARKDPDSSDWIITEDTYKKVYLKPKTHLVFGDVVATGTSLEFGLRRLFEEADNSHCDVESTAFFTIGGIRSTEILENTRLLHPGLSQAVVIYFEGIFLKATHSTPVTIKIDGTDLLRRDSILAPEFIESQYENPAYPIERCTIYDAGSRAFDVSTYFADVLDYWEQCAALAEGGMSYQALLEERFPEIDKSALQMADLGMICREQLGKLQFILGPNARGRSSH